MTEVERLKLRETELEQERDRACAERNGLLDDLVKVVAALQQAMLKRRDPDAWVSDAYRIVVKYSCNKLDGTNAYCTLLKGHPGECPCLPHQSPCQVVLWNSLSPQNGSCSLNQGHSGEHQWVPFLRRVRDEE